MKTTILHLKGIKTTRDNWGAAPLFNDEGRKAVVVDEHDDVVYELAGIKLLRQAPRGSGRTWDPYLFVPWWRVIEVEYRYD